MNAAIRQQLRTGQLHRDHVPVDGHHGRGERDFADGQEDLIVHGQVQLGAGRKAHPPTVAVRLAHDYADAYATAYRWFRNTAPGGWLLSAGFIPGSPLRITLAAVKRRASSTT